VRVAFLRHLQQPASFGLHCGDFAPRSFHLCAGVVAGKHASSMKHVATGSAADCKLAVYRCEPNAALSALYGALVANLAVGPDSWLPPLKTNACPASFHACTQRHNRSTRV